MMHIQKKDKLNNFDGLKNLLVKKIKHVKRQQTVEQIPYWQTSFKNQNLH